MSKVIIVQAGGGFDKVRVDQETTQPPKSNQIQIRLHANSLNYHDYAVVSGMWGPATNRIPMADGAGEVIAVGDKVHEFSVGDKVCTTFFPTWLDGEPNVKGFDQVPGDGVDGYAREVVTVHTSAVTHAPKKWDFLQSSTLTTAGLTAWKALFEDYSLKPKHSILIQGTGGVSIYALQFAKAMGAKVIATSSSDQKIEKLKAMGADYCINYKTNPNWSHEVLQHTSGIGVDHIVEVGGPGSLNQSIEAIKVGGHISIIGILSGLEGNLNIVNALIKQVRLQGVLVGNRAQQIRMIDFINEHHMFPVIDRVFALEKIVEAFQYQESNNHFGKICLKI